MRGIIVQPADLSGTALTELKEWLGISSNAEDALLVDLLHTGVALCQAFTGVMPIEQTIEERLPVQSQATIAARPVQSIVAVDVVNSMGERSPLNTNAYQSKIDAEGSVRLSFSPVPTEGVFVIQATVGLAATWADVPSALKQGIIRMAAHHYRDRDRVDGSSRSAPPPASVAALWRPWRSARLV